MEIMLSLNIYSTSPTREFLLIMYPQLKNDQKIVIPSSGLLEAEGTIE